MDLVMLATVLGALLNLIVMIATLQTAQNTARATEALHRIEDRLDQRISN